MRSLRTDLVPKGRETTPRRLRARSGGAPAALENLEPRQLLTSVFAVNDSNTLLEFDSASPGIIIRSLPITGLGAGELMTSLEFNPLTEQLVGIPSGSRTPVYTIDRLTGVATRLGPGVPFGFPTERATGLAYDERNNYFRYMDESFGNYRIDPVTGRQLRNDAGQEGLAEITYAPFDGSLDSFRFFGVNYLTNAFMQLDPERMTVFSTGPLGLDIDTHVGLDIAHDGSVHLAVRSGGLTRFGTIAADGHTFVQTGLIGDGSHVIRGMAVEPARRAPVLDTLTLPALDPIDEDASTNAGTLVRDLLRVGGQPLVTDANPGALQGIALTGVDSSIGLWQYSLDGVTWNAVGAPSESLALLLPANASARIRLVPAANFNGVASVAVAFRAWDQTAFAPGQRVDPGEGGGQSAFSAAATSASLTIRAVRDLPTIAIPQPVGGAFRLDDNQTVAPFASATIGYIDNPAQALTVDVSLMDPSHGQITAASLAAAGFTTVDAASRTYRFTGTAAAATSAIRQLVFDPTDNLVPVGQSTASLFRITVADGLGAPAQTFSPFIASRSVRNAPTIDSSAAPIAITDKQTAVPFAFFTIGDVEAGPRTLTVEVSLAASHGTLSAASLAASGFSAVDGSPGVFRFTGTAADATTALRQLVYIPSQALGPARSVTPVTLAVSVLDGLGAPVQSSSPVISVTAQNDRPALAGLTVANSIRKNKTVRVFRQARITDVDLADRVTVTVRLNFPGKGRFTQASLNASGFASLGGGRYRFTGTPAAATNRIRKLNFAWAPTLNDQVNHRVTFRLTIADASGAQIMNNQTHVTLKR